MSTDRPAGDREGRSRRRGLTVGLQQQPGGATEELAASLVSNVAECLFGGHHAARGAGVEHFVEGRRHRHDAGDQVLE